MRIDIGKIAFIHNNIRLFLLIIEKHFGIKVTITSLYRPKDDGIHGTIPLRAADIRARNPEIAKIIVDHLNDRWIYDPQR